jgi:hypothetical protein
VKTDVQESFSHVFNNSIDNPLSSPPGLTGIELRTRILSADFGSGSVSGRLRDERLNQHWCLSLDEARAVTGVWREVYNPVRPHA